MNQTIKTSRRAVDAFPKKRQSEQGIVLIIALVALVAMTFAVFSMLRSSGAALSVAGNIAFKQNATSASDKGVEAAIAWVTSQSVSALRADAAPGYFATWDDSFDPLAYNWSSTTAKTVPSDGFGNDGLYVVHRMCAIAGSPTALGQSCVSPSLLNNKGGSGLNRAGAPGSSGGSPVGDGGGGTSAGAVGSINSYYRITTRVTGPRNTRSYTQVMIY